MDTEVVDKNEEKKSSKVNGKPPDPATEVVNQEAMSISEWLKQSFAGDVMIQIKLHRNAPATYMNQPTKGFLQEFNEIISEDQIKEMYGGGVYRMHCFRMGPNGNMIAAGTKVFTIAGNPKIDEHLLPKTAQEKINAGIIQPPPPPSAVDQAMSMVANAANEDRKRADKLADELRSNNKFDPGMISTVTAPYLKQIDSLADANRELQAQINILLNKKPETAFQDKMLEKMIDTDSARVSAMRAQHESELRMLKENHQAELVRRDEAATRREERMDAASQRELATVKESARTQVDSIKIAYDGRIEGLNNTIESLKQSLSETRQELVALKSQKDEGPLDQLTKLAALKEALSGFSGDDNEPAEPSTFEKVFTAAAPMIQSIGDRIAAGGQQPQQMVPAQMAPQQQLEAPAAPPSPFPGVSRSELLQAIGFVEMAIRNNTPPETFAQSARSQIPGSLIESIKTMGPDEFVKHLPLQEGSPLANMAGKAYLRKVIKALVEPAA